MRDFGHSDNPRVQTQLNRLARLSVPDGRLGLEVISELLDRLGNPHLSMPPTFHVAGTNGKGSVCAFLRSIMEADGLKVHATTSPHLVRYNERIRIAGKLITDEELANLLCEVLDAGEQIGPSFFESTIAAAFLAFSRHHADACIVEVGLGGRLDATNILPRPVGCAIAALGLDHEQFLLAPEAGAPTQPLARIAFEKAGIVKEGVPLVTLSHDQQAAEQIEQICMHRAAPLFVEGRDWHYDTRTDQLHYRDASGALQLPLPALFGHHQLANAALAVALVRHQEVFAIAKDSLARGIATAHWPARLQRLPRAITGFDREIWLDGGHNASAACALARQFSGRKIHLVIGMIQSKSPGAMMSALGTLAESIHVVPVPGHEWHEASRFGLRAKAAANVEQALSRLPDDGLPALICGSLYLAGDVLRNYGILPD